ncbi:MAG: hypothetical protein JSW05_10990, partial [Candidatus Thorarchaeota archaeon]
MPGVPGLCCSQTTVLHFGHLISFFFPTLCQMRDFRSWNPAAQINTGGVKEGGSDAVNEVTYQILDVIEEMRLLQP